MSESDIPNAAKALADLSKFPSIPDRLQQGIIDFLYLGRDLINPAGFCTSRAFIVNGKCVINTAHLYYDGGSQGAIFGGALTAVDPDFTRAALNVAGMNYGLLLTRSSDFPEFASILYRGYPNPLARALLFPFIPNLWDHGEMDGYAEHVTSHPGSRARQFIAAVLMTVAFGDHQVTNWASEIEARTIGAPSCADRCSIPGVTRAPGPTGGSRGSAPSPSPAVPRMVVGGDLGPLRPCPNDGVTVCPGVAGRHPTTAAGEQPQHPGRRSPPDRTGRRSPRVRRRLAIGCVRTAHWPLCAATARATWRAGRGPEAAPERALPTPCSRPRRSGDTSRCRCSPRS